MHVRPQHILAHRSCEQPERVCPKTPRALLPASCNGSYCKLPNLSPSETDSVFALSRILGFETESSGRFHLG